MNKTQKEVLQKYQQEMVRSVYVDPELLGKFYQAGLFDSIAIDSITIEKENDRKVLKMLDILQTKGVDVFEKFVGILEQKNVLLAQALRTSLEEQSQPDIYKYIKTNTPRNNQRPLTPSEDSSQRDDDQEDPSKTVPTEELTLSPFDINIPVEKDMPTQQKLCFDCLQKLCPTCQIRIHSNDSFGIKVPRPTRSDNNKGPETKEFNRSTIKTFLTDMCLKKKIDVGIFEDYSEYKDSEDLSCSDILSVSEYDLEETTSATSTLNTFNFLERQVNSFLNKIKSLEDENSKCYEILDDRDQKESLHGHFENLLKKCEELQEQVNIKTAFADDLMKERKIEEKLKKVMIKEKEDKISELQQVNLKFQKDFEKLSNRLGDCERTIKRNNSVEEMELFYEEGGKGGFEMEKHPSMNDGHLHNARPGYLNDNTGQHTRFQAKVGLEKSDIARLQELQAARERNKSLLKKQPNARNYIFQPVGHRSLHDLGLPKIGPFDDAANSQNLRLSKKNPYYQSKFPSYY